MAQENEKLREELKQRDMITADDILAKSIYI